MIDSTLKSLAVRFDRSHSLEDGIALLQYAKRFLPENKHKRFVITKRLRIPVSKDGRVVQVRYAPKWHHTSTCLLADWQTRTFVFHGPATTAYQEGWGWGGYVQWDPETGERKRVQSNPVYCVASG